MSSGINAMPTPPTNKKGICQSSLNILVRYSEKGTPRMEATANALITDPIAAPLLS